MSQIGQVLINGLLLGGTLALVALGFSLVWGIMNVVNLAHGPFIMLGAYTTYWLYTLLGVDPFISLPISMLVLFILGYLIQRYIINLVIRAPLLATFLLTFGLEIIIVNLANRFWKGDLRSVTTAYSGIGLTLTLPDGSLQIPYIRLAGLVISLLLALSLHLFLTRTRTGNAIRATGMDIDAARLTGVQIGHTYALTFAIGAALAGAAGTLISMTFPVFPSMGSSFTLRAFTITVLGGLGNIFGVILGAGLFSLVEVLGGSLLPGFKDAITLVMLVLVLIIRPSGLLGKAFYQ